MLVGKLQKIRAIGEVLKDGRTDEHIHKHYTSIYHRRSPYIYLRKGHLPIGPEHILYHVYRENLFSKSH